MTIDELEKLKIEMLQKQIGTAVNIQNFFNKDFFKDPSHFSIRQDIMQISNSIFDKSLELIEKEINKLKGGFNG